MNQEQEPKSLHDKEAELAVLGALLMDNAVAPRIIPILGTSTEVFFTVDHQLIYQSILSVYEDSQTTDIILVAKLMKATDRLKRCGGTVYLHDLQDRIVETENTEFHAEIVRDTWVRRQMALAGGQIIEIAHDEERTMVEVMDDAQHQIFNVTAGNKTDSFQPIGTLSLDAIKELERLSNSDETTAGLATGYTEFDRMTTGFHPGDLIIVAGRPSMGKTSFALNVAVNVGLREDVQDTVIIFSVEMPARQVVLRLLSTETAIPFGRLRSGNIKDTEWSTLTEATTVFHANGHRILVNDNSSLTVGDMRVEARRIKSEIDNLSLIIVDYMQLMTPQRRHYTNREQEVSEISRELKAIAGELDVPVIACSQINREVEKREDKRPKLADLRESGSIEQDADLVAFLHREDYYDTEGNEMDTSIVDLLIRKQRNGPTGDVQLKFYKDFMRFSNLGPGG